MIKVTRCGGKGIGRRKINLSTVFAGQYVAVREAAEAIWRVSFTAYDPGLFDRELNKVEPFGRNPFAPKVLPMLSE
jgi:putative transposase